MKSFDFNVKDPQAFADAQESHWKLIRYCCLPPQLRDFRVAVCTSVPRTWNLQAWVSQGVGYILTAVELASERDTVKLKAKVARICLRILCACASLRLSTRCGSANSCQVPRGRCQTQDQRRSSGFRSCAGFRRCVYSWFQAFLIVEPRRQCSSDAVHVSMWQAFRSHNLEQASA